MAAMPTLSQVRGWETAHLTEAARFWTDTAVTWEDHFSQLANQISMPGGTEWLGDTADAAYQRAHLDRLTVIGQADQLHDAARIARAGADDISWARDAVLKVVDTAENAGFVVGEAFSVTKPGVFHPAAAAIMQAQAEAIAADLRTTVGTLVATDTGVGTSLTAATAGVGTAVFPESADEPKTVQLVDYKTSPPPTPSPTPSPELDEMKKRLDEQQKQIDELTEKAKGSPASDAASSFMNGCVAGAAGAGIAGAVTGPVDAPIIMGGCVVGGVTSALGKLAEEWTTNALEGSG